jgi:hypothetical protein
LRYQSRNNKILILKMADPGQGDIPATLRIATDCGKGQGAA